MARRPDGTYEYGVCDTSNPMYHFIQAETKKKADDEAAATRHRRHREQEEQERQRRATQAARNQVAYSSSGSSYVSAGSGYVPRRSGAPLLRFLIGCLVIYFLATHALLAEAALLDIAQAILHAWIYLFGSLPMWVQDLLRSIPQHP